MNRYSATETHFALLTIEEQRKASLESEMSALTSRLGAIDLAVTTGEGKSSVLLDGIFLCVFNLFFCFCFYFIFTYVFFLNVLQFVLHVTCYIIFQSVLIKLNEIT